MLEIIAIVVVLILCFMGVVELYRAIVFRFLLPERCKEFIVLVPAYGHDETLEMALRCAQSRVRWFRGHGQVVCLNCGLDEENARLCALACEQLGCVKLMTMNEMCGFCQEELQTQED